MRTIFGLAILVMQSAMTGCDPNNCPVCDVQIHDASSASMPDLSPPQLRCQAAKGIYGEPLTVQMDTGAAVPLCFDFNGANATNDDGLRKAGFNLALTASHCKGWGVTAALQPSPISTESGDKICGMLTPDIKSSVLAYKYFALSIVQETANLSANVNTSIKFRINDKAESMDFGPKTGTLTSSKIAQSVFIFETSKLLAGSNSININFELNVPNSAQIPSWQIQSLAILGILN